MYQSQISARGDIKFLVQQREIRVQLRPWPADNPNELRKPCENWILGGQTDDKNFSSSETHGKKSLTKLDSLQIKRLTPVTATILKDFLYDSWFLCPLIWKTRRFWSVFSSFFIWYESKLSFLLSIPYTAEFWNKRSLLIPRPPYSNDAWKLLTFLARKESQKQGYAMRLQCWYVYLFTFGREYFLAELLSIDISFRSDTCRKHMKKYLHPSSTLAV